VLLATGVRDGVSSGAVLRNVHVDDQGGQGFAIHILGDDQQRPAGPNWTLVHCAPRRCPDMVVVMQGRPLDLIPAQKAIGF
jgi:hypothetical protein